MVVTHARSFAARAQASTTRRRASTYEGGVVRGQMRRGIHSGSRRLQKVQWATAR